MVAVVKLWTCNRIVTGSIKLRLSIRKEVWCKESGWKLVMEFNGQLVGVEEMREIQRVKSLYLI